MHLFHSAAALALSFQFVAVVFGEQPCVRFDVAPVIEAVEVSTPAFEATHPHEKLIELRFPVSSLVSLGSEEALLQYLYLFSSDAATFQIVDYSPKTEMDSHIVGNLSIERSRGASTSLGLKAHLPPDLALKGDATASRGSNSNDSARYEQLPPLQLVAASGTLRRGRAAYFKLKPSIRSTLEGDKTFQVVVRVPANWRADLVTLTCQAYGRPRGVLPLHDQTDLVCGSRQFLIGIYVQGDMKAKSTVEELLSSHHRLRHLAATHAREVKAERYPSWGHKLGAALAVVKPRIPNAWLDELLESERRQGFERHLPDTIRSAAAEYRQVRNNVRHFAG